MGIEQRHNMRPGNSIALITELARCHPLFIEDPVTPDNVRSFREVSAKVAMRMAAGGRNTTTYEFREYIEHSGIASFGPTAE